MLLLLCISLLCGRSIGRAAAQSRPAYELVDAVNQFRAQNGQAALQVDASLMAAAQKHAAWMAANHHYSHTGDGGSTPRSRATAAGYVGTVYENIEGGTDLTPQQAVYWWQQDSIHLTTMLLPHHVHIGVGYAVDGDQKLFVLEVGQPSQAWSAGRKAAPSIQPTLTPQAVDMAPILVSTPRADGAIVHVVQQGQTAWAIAARYGVAVVDLLKLNNLPGGAVLHPGDSILIRLGAGQSLPATPTSPITHVVQQGETIWTIAARSGVSVDDLLALNHLNREAVLHPGDTLILRQVPPTTTGTPTASPTGTSTDLPTITPPPLVVAIASIPATTSILGSPLPSLSTFAAAPTPSPAPDEHRQPYQQSVFLPSLLIAGLVGMAAGAILILYRRR